jgi:hypothetical protein
LESFKFLKNFISFNVLTWVAFLQAGLPGFPAADFYGSARSFPTGGGAPNCWKHDFKPPGFEQGEGGTRNLPIGLSVRRQPEIPVKIY